MEFIEDYVLADWDLVLIKVIGKCIRSGFCTSFLCTTFEQENYLDQNVSAGRILFMNQYLKGLVCFYKKAGGRRNPLVLGDKYCVHFRIPGDEKYLGIRFFVENEPYIEPDLWYQAEVLLLSHPNVDYSKLKVGQEFEILEES